MTLAETMNRLNDDGGEKDKKDDRRVVCAAQRHRESGLIICGARHFDPVMRKLIDAFDDWDGWNNSEGGFIDQYCEFLTREEALEIAERNGQILHDIECCKGYLFSEHLY